MTYNPLADSENVWYNGFYLLQKQEIVQDSFALEARLQISFFFKAINEIFVLFSLIILLNVSNINKKQKYLTAWSLLNLCY